MCRCALFPKGPTTAPLYRSILISRMRRAAFLPPLFCHPLPAARTSQTTLLRRCAGGACIVIFQKKILYFIVWLARLCFACGRKKTRSQKIILYDLLYVGGAGLAPDHLLTFVYTQPILDALFVTRLWIEMPRLVDERVSRGVL